MTLDFFEATNRLIKACRPPLIFAQLAIIILVRYSVYKMGKYYAHLVTRGAAGDGSSNSGSGSGS